MDLTTLARVKAHLEGGVPMTPGASDEALLSALIALYSGIFETRLNRLVLASARTYQVDVEDGQQIFLLPGFPVSAVASVKHDVDRAFAASSLLDTDDYYCELATGVLTIEYPLFPGAGALQVVYTGGMAATAAAFVTAYPEIAGACDLQVASHFQRRKAIGAHGMNAGAGSLSFTGPVTLLPEVEAVLQRHRRIPL